MTFYGPPRPQAQPQQQPAPWAQAQPLPQPTPWTPPRPQQTQPQWTPQQQQQQRTEDPWATFQSPAAAPPALDPWAAGRAAQPAYFDMGTPGDSKGGGKGGGAYPYQREMRIDSRSWGDHKKLDVATTFEGFQVWKDRAMMFLSRERPDVRRLLTWAESQSKELGGGPPLAGHAARHGRLGLGRVRHPRWHQVHHLG